MEGEEPLCCVPCQGEQVSNEQKERTGESVKSHKREKITHTFEDFMLRILFQRGKASVARNELPLTAKKRAQLLAASFFQSPDNVRERACSKITTLHSEIRFPLPAEFAFSINGHDMRLLKIDDEILITEMGSCVHRGKRR